MKIKYWGTAAAEGIPGAVAAPVKPSGGTKSQGRGGIAKTQKVGTNITAQGTLKDGVALCLREKKTDPRPEKTA